MLRHRVTCALAIALFVVTTAGASFGQTLASGPQVVTFYSDVDDTEQPYGLYLPRKFDAKKRYPLVIMLHGAGSNHRLDLKRAFGKSNIPGETDVEASRYFQEWADVDFVVAAPYARGTMGYQGVAEKDVMDVLADVKRRFPIDEDRVYLTGLSMGGGGTMWIGLTRPDIWAAIAPVCPAPPQETSDYAPNALNVPVHFYQGGADPVVPAAGTREWVERLKGMGARVEYDEYPGVQHDSWVPAYKDGQVFKWFGQFKRDRYPDRVRFASSRYQYSQAYWVRLDQLTSGTVASIDAKFTGPNRVEVTTSALGGFTLKLDGHPKYSKRKPVEVVVDGTRIEAPAAEAISFTKAGGSWAAGSAVPGVGSKRPGAEGPISDAIATRHVYVYGTGGNPSREEVDARRMQAEQAANWAAYRGWFLGRIMVFPRVAADVEIRPSDFESANLVLFGTKETNTVIAKFADRLPIELGASAGDYGLVYVFPVDTRYVVVNSGLPWWTPPTAPPDPNVRRAFRSLPSSVAGLADFEDYILFKGGPDKPVAQGRFDASWRLPEADARKMAATGVVTVRSR